MNTRVLGALVGLALISGFAGVARDGEHGTDAVRAPELRAFHYRRKTIMMTTRAITTLALGALLGGWVTTAAEAVEPWRPHAWRMYGFNNLTHSI